MLLGGSGGFASTIVEVVPDTVYTVEVGTGGFGFVDKDGAEYSADPGASGFVLIAYGGDI